MPWEMVQIKSWRHYWNDYIVKGLQDGLSVSKIHDNVMEEMRKEVFNLLMFRAKASDISEVEDNDKNVVILESIKNTTRQKFNALMRECRKFRETKDILNEADFKKLSPYPDGDEEEEEEEFEDDAEEPDEMTAEWPGLSEEDEPREENTHVSEGT